MKIFIKRFEELSSYLKKQGLEYLYLSNSDYYLSEYCAKENSLPSYLTPFTGSTSEVLITAHKKLYLFVDGRYHLQAELECYGIPFIEVVKVSTQTTLFQAMLQVLAQNKATKLGCVTERTSLAYVSRFEKVGFKLAQVPTQKVEDLVGHAYKPKVSPIYQVEEKIVPANYQKKFADLALNKQQVIYLSSCDDIAWLSHCRSFQAKGNSYFFAKAVVTENHLYMFIPPVSQVSKEAQKCTWLTFIPTELEQLEKKLRELLSKLTVKNMLYDPETITWHDLLTIKNLGKKDFLIPQAFPVTKHKIYKSKDELAEYENSFMKSSVAIAETLRQAKKKILTSKKFSEKDLANLIWKNYQKQGALDLSFNTISAAGKNSAIIHYGACSEKIFFKSGEMALLDSGAYYASGYATDCTRSFVPGFSTLSSQKKKDWQQLYTLVLKAQLQAEMAIFKPGTLGNAIDQLARGSMLAHGLDFQHGLGHGVGIRVHDPGAGRLSPASREELHPGVLCSIEPGYYSDKKFGIRLENVVQVAKHPKFSGLLYFKPLIYVAWEEELIDWSMLAPEQISYLKSYQARCKKLGTHTSI